MQCHHVFAIHSQQPGVLDSFCALVSNVYTLLLQAFTSVNDDATLNWQAVVTALCCHLIRPASCLCTITLLPYKKLQHILTMI